MSMVRMAGVLLCEAPEYTRAGELKYHRSVEQEGGMRLRFWGTRGSIAKPGPATVRYGGNTSCVEVRAEDTLIVLDCGTGAHELGQQLVAANPEPMRGHMLISHTH